MSEKEIYFQNLTYEKTHDNKGCVMGEMIFRNTMTYEEFLDIQNERFFVLNDKTQNNWNELKKWLNEQVNYYSLCDDDYKEFNVLSSVEGKMQELEGNNE